MARKLYNFLIDADLAAGLKRLKDRDGTPESEAVRRAIRDYLKRRGVLPTTPGQRTLSVRKGRT